MTSPRDILRIVITELVREWRAFRRRQAVRAFEREHYLRPNSFVSAVTPLITVDISGWQPIADATIPRPPLKLARSTSPARLGGIPRETVRTPLTVALEARLTAAQVTRSHELARRDILVRGSLPVS